MAFHNAIKPTNSSPNISQVLDLHFFFRIRLSPLFLFRRWGDLAPGPDLVTIEIEHNRNRYHDSSKTSKQCAGPLDAQVVESLICEEREPSTKEGSKQRIRCDG